jgi:hypothetical protein
LTAERVLVIVEIDFNFQNQAGAAAMREVFPPPPHDPREREVLMSVGDWEVRAFGEGERLRSYLITRGFWHLQLWHNSRLSILTPSRLTKHQFEGFPLYGRKHRESSYEQLCELFQREHGISPPGPMLVNALRRWFIERLEKEASASIL